MRRFVIIGRTASASADFRLEDLPGTSGRLDVLLRCLRAGLLVSHGLRRDTVVYLVLLGSAEAPKAVRFDGAAARYVRPDERSLATSVQKALRSDVPEPSAGFVEVRAGIALARGGLAAVLADLPPNCAHYVLEAAGADVRSARLESAECVFFIGDHLGLDECARAELEPLQARALSLGPVTLHADDAVTLVCNELDRREMAPPARPDVPVGAR